MRNPRGMLSLAIMGSLLLTVLTPVPDHLEVSAAPPVPHHAYGHAYSYNNSTLPLGELITSWIDGVQYGDNYTWYDWADPDPANRSGKYDIDTYGNWYVDNSSETPEIKEGGDIGDNIMYVWGDLTSGNQTVWPNTIFRENETWDVSTVVYMDLHEAYLQPPALLKINNVTTRPSDGGTQYLYIYNPSSQYVDLSANPYYLEKNDGSRHSNMFPLPGEAIPPNGYLCVDLNSTSYLDPYGDELKLVWENPGGFYAPNGGNDVVVDRLEFNASVNGTHYGEPDNTIMTDAESPGLGQELRRYLPGLDTNDNEQDFIIAEESPRCGPLDMEVAPPTNLFADLSGPNLKHVTLSWDLSADDGAGENDVVGYEIYYSATYSSDRSGYALLGTVPAGTSTYKHVNVGHGDPRSYFYYVRVIDGNGNVADTEGQAGKFTKFLPAGMQLVSIPFVQSDEYLPHVFQTVDFVRVMYYDKYNRNWKTWDTSKFTQTLTTADHEKGYWVDVRSDSWFTVAGQLPPMIEIELEVGWNMVGYPSFINRTVAETFAGVDYQRVECYDETKKPWFVRKMKDDEIMSAGNGYWIHISSSGSAIWVISN